MIGVMWVSSFFCCSAAGKSSREPHTALSPWLMEHNHLLLAKIELNRDGMMQRVLPPPCWTPLLCRYPCPLGTVRSRTGRALDGFQPLKSATWKPMSLQWWMTTLLTFSQVHFVFIRLLSCSCYAWLSIKGRILDFLKMRWQTCLPTSLTWAKSSFI